MRNKYPATCYRCGTRVECGDGHFEKYGGGWRTQHADCAIACRGTSIHYINAPDTNGVLPKNRTAKAPTP